MVTPLHEVTKTQAEREAAGPVLSTCCLPASTLAVAPRTASAPAHWAWTSAQSPARGWSGPQEARDFSPGLLAAYGSRGTACPHPQVVGLKALHPSARRFMACCLSSCSAVPAAESWGPVPSDSSARCSSQVACAGASSASPQMSLVPPVPSTYAMVWQYPRPL